MDGISCADWVGSNQLLPIPLCVRIAPDYRHGQGVAAVTIANQEDDDIGPSGRAPLTLPSGGWNGLRPGLANYLDSGLPWTLPPDEDGGASVLYRARAEP